MKNVRLRIRFLRRNLLKFDQFDYGLLGFAAGSALAHQFHPKLRRNTLKRREEKAMRKLKLDLERQSPIIESSPSGLFTKVQQKDRENYQKIYANSYNRMVINLYWHHLIRLRGGQLEQVWDQLDLDNDDVPITEKLLLATAHKFHLFVLTLLSVLKNKEVALEKGMLRKFFYRELRTQLQAFLLRYSLQIGYKKCGSAWKPVVTFLGGVIQGAAISIWVPVLKDTASVTIGTPLAVLVGRKFLQAFYWVPDEERLVNEFIQFLNTQKIKSLDEYFRSLSRDLQEEIMNSTRVQLLDLELNLDLSDSEQVTRFLGHLKKHLEEVILPEVNVGPLPTSAPFKFSKKAFKSKVANLSKFKNQTDEFVTLFPDAEETILNEFEQIRIRIQD